jgi:D-alanyl-D-alanine carboxypeptidase/D-alanyl-D-alanine-endopeptidase (penicillin-binding protein 4)
MKLVLFYLIPITLPSRRNNVQRYEMMRNRRGRAFAAAFLILALPAAAHAELPAPIAAKLREAGMTPEAMGAIVLDARTGDTVFSWQADRPFQPASTMKLLTSIVALEKLGPQWRGRAELVTAANVDDGVLRGDLVLRGGADPDLDWPAFRDLLVAARNRGIREVAGDFVIDASLFDPSRTDVGVAPFDETPEFRYNAIPDALFLNSYLAEVRLDSRGGKLAATLSTPLEGVSVEPAMTLAKGRCDAWDDEWKYPEVRREDGLVRLRLQGEFPLECDATAAINVLDRVEYADRLFRALWRSLGGTFRGKTRFAPAPGGESIARHQSRALGAIARDIEKHSDNPVARIMFLALGTLDEGPAGGETLARAERVVREWMRSRGIDDAGLVLENGSGLSRIEKIRPEQLARVVLAARSSRWAPEFTAALPIVGIDGGMRKRLKDSTAAASARIKTGTLRDVSAVAGFVDDASGRTLVAVGMINHPLAKASVARPILDAFLDEVARGGGKASAAK